jgi:hypothetical protein
MRGWGAYRTDLPSDPEPILLFYCGPCASRIFGRMPRLDDRPADPAE